MGNKLLKVNIFKKLKEFDLEVDFELKQKRLGILGPSGCGKSMTLKSVAGIVNPDGGVVSLTSDEETVYFDSINKINLKPQKRNVGYLFQNYALFPNMTVEENVASGLSKGSDNKIVSEMIKRFHLEGLEKRYPRQLSGGQQQRVALA
uniref:ATP-binding cassette domain-containing protein n=1 Tax=Methanobrevibacter sp. TaxID=66852 RepID=UPI003976CB7E